MWVMAKSEMSMEIPSLRVLTGNVDVITLEGRREVGHLTFIYVHSQFYLNLRSSRKREGT